MMIIGEKINGTIPSVARAIASRDENYICELARKQVRAGADYLDICAGGSPDKELETLNWLIDLVQDTVDTPLCIDSPNAEIIEAVLPRVKRSGIINSVSGEGSKGEVIYPLLRDNDWQIIALTCNDKGIPYDAGSKVAIAVQLIEKAAQYDISPERILIDPLVMALSAVNDTFLTFREVITEIKRIYPTVRITSGLSNISFGMPYRRAVNLNFLSLAIAAGMDTAIIDPTDKDTIATILATEALLGRDKYCRRYYTAYRQGLFGKRKTV